LRRRVVEDCISSGNSLSELRAHQRRRSDTDDEREMQWVKNRREGVYGEEGNEGPT